MSKCLIELISWQVMTDQDVLLENSDEESDELFIQDLSSPARNGTDSKSMSTNSTVLSSSSNENNYNSSQRVSNQSSTNVKNSNIEENLVLESLEHVSCKTNVSNTEKNTKHKSLSNSGKYKEISAFNDSNELNTSQSIITSINSNKSDSALTDNVTGSLNDPNKSKEADPVLEPNNSISLPAFPGNSSDQESNKLSVKDSTKSGGQHSTKSGVEESTKSSVKQDSPLQESSKAIVAESFLRAKVLCS